VVPFQYEKIKGLLWRQSYNTNQERKKRRKFKFDTSDVHSKYNSQWHFRVKRSKVRVKVIALE